MRDRNQQQKSASFATTMQAGFASSVLTFAIRWVPDCVVNRKIVDSNMVNTGKSFFNIGIAWDLAYRIPANTVVFPAQRYFQEFLLNNLDECDRTRTNKIAIQTATGWAAGVAEPIVFYSLDSMRTLVQTKPAVFNGRSVHYFLTHQSQLYRGLGLVLVRNSVTNIVGWGAKAATEISLEKTNMPLELRTMPASFVFGFTRVAMGYPFATIGVLVQADTEKRRGALTMLNHRLKEKGFLSLYQGFFMKGGAQILTTFLQMWLFNWWTHPERKPFSASSFFSATQQMQFFPQWKKECGNNNGNDRADGRVNKP